jgi:asparagine synthase (glutamine-hydrolysing)
MCGICGLVSWNAPPDGEALGRMLAALVHRGPDGEGRHASGPAALGVRRLAVIDIETGSQPAFNEDRSVAVVLNGEIYNYLELRAGLAARGHRFTGRGDTEVLPHLYEEMGEDFLRPLVGMFAIALWDARKPRLLLARDRLGQKPLFYCRPGASGLAFASEIKALAAAGLCSREPDYAALGEYLGKLYIGGERTIYREVRQLPPAHLALAGRAGFELRRYWDAWAVPARQGELREAALAEELEALLLDSVRLQLRSDVPTGCFLSGGLDSSVISALARRLAPEVSTFTVGFGEAEYDESGPARRVAEHLGTRHVEMRAGELTADLAAAVPGMFDQPFGDSSALPTWMVARLARAGVTVALSGDGADELFGGYRRYRARAAARLLSRLPGPVRGAVATAGRALGSRRGRRGGAGEDLRRLAALAGELGLRPDVTRPPYFDRAAQAELLAPAALEAVREAGGADRPAARPERPGAGQAMLLDLAGYLPDDILTKVDRASMAVSLEARAPYLDHRVVEFVLSLPPGARAGGRGGKRLLRRLAARLLPAETLRRGKQGFAVPLQEWFAPEGAGRRLLESLLARGALAGLVRPEAVARLLDRHARRRERLGEHLWALAVLGLWRESAAPGF